MLLLSPFRPGLFSPLNLRLVFNHGIRPLPKPEGLFSPQPSSDSPRFLRVFSAAIPFPLFARASPRLPFSNPRFP